MTLDELNKLIRDTINAVVSVADVIKYYPNAPRPSLDYASVNIAELTRIGTIDSGYSPSGEDLSEKVALQYTAMVSVNFYRENALQNAAILAGAFHSNSIIDSFNSAGVGFTRPSSVRDLTQLIDQGHEGRGQVDIFVHFELTPVIETVTGVDTVKVVGDVDDQEEIIDNVNLEISLNP